jgi:hypothetical protein
MNERIQQLAEQAYLYQEHDTFLTAALENFAQLIVQNVPGLACLLLNQVPLYIWYQWPMLMQLRNILELRNDASVIPTSYCRSRH